MDETRKQYWQDPKELWYPEKSHALLELRASMAWELVHSWGSIAGVFMDREDSGKRAVMELQTPGALVTRCFAIADAFVNRAENREEIRQMPAKPEKKDLNAGIAETKQSLDALKGAIEQA